MPSVGAESVRSDADWQAESDLNTLIEAEKIEKDSKRLKLVMARKKKLAEALDDVGGSKAPMKKKAKRNKSHY